MGARRANPRAIKQHFSYTISELASALGVHKNTVRNWQRNGLEVLTGRPVLIHGAIARTFLAERNRARKQPCPPGMIYCFGCKKPSAPALGMVDLVNLKRGVGNLRALCETCGRMIYRRARQDGLATTMPGLQVQIRQGE